MALPDLLLFAVSLLGLWLVPAALGRAAWIFPAAFAAVGFVLLAFPAPFHPSVNPWVGLALSQGPWILLALDLLAGGKASPYVDRIPLRALLAFSLVHLIALRHVPAAARGDLAPLFALETAFSAALICVGALLLLSVNRPGSPWYRAALLFWNTYALAATLGLGFRIQRSAPLFPVGRFSEPSRELHAYFTGWPGGLETFFWIPVALSIHAAVFYRVFKNRPRPAF